jgi:hypothetical protein
MESIIVDDFGVVTKQRTKSDSNLKALMSD